MEKIFLSKWTAYTNGGEIILFPALPYLQKNQ